MVKKLIIYLFILTMLGCASTRTSLKQFSGLDEKLAVQDYAGAITQLKSVKDKHYKAKDRVLYYLDLGMLYYYNQEPEISNETLSKAEIGIDENYTKSISKAAVSFLLNDNALDYAGEDYEDIYLNIFKSLNYLTLGSFDGAFVEIRRINNKLDGLEDKYKKMAESYQNTENNKAKFTTAENRFHNDALGRYLSMLIYRAEGKLDDARIDSNKLSDAWTQQSHIYNFPKPDLSNFLEPTDKARLNIIGFCGKSPVKKAKTLYIHTEKNLIIVATTERKPEGETTVGFLNALPWEGVQKGYHFKFQLPFIEEVNSNVGSIRVVVNESQSVELSLLEDFGKVAVETFKLKEPLIYTKTIARTVIKGLFAEKRKEEMEKKIANPLLGLAARLATDAAVDATENADLRISRFFPDQARIAEILVEPGCHQLKIEYYSKNGTLLFVDDLGMIDVKKNDLNLIKSCYLN